MCAGNRPIRCAKFGTYRDRRVAYGARGRGETVAVRGKMQDALLDTFDALSRARQWERDDVHQSSSPRRLPVPLDAGVDE